MKIGEKIKNLRTSRGLTQAQLAGEDFTRNMLCQIERGAALPSLPTLMIISERLGVPAGFFLSDEETPFLYKKITHIREIYAEYEKGHFAECIRLIKKHLGNEYDDEIAFLRAKSGVEIGKRHLNNGMLESSAKALADALVWCKRTRIDTGSIRARCTLLSAIATNIQSPRLEFDDEEFIRQLEISSDYELYSYLIEDTEYSYSSKLYAEHLKARSLIKKGRLHDALEIMSHLDEIKNVEGANAFFIFRLYSDIEMCYRETSDYERAYIYSTKRISLLSAFKS